MEYCDDVSCSHQSKFFAYSNRSVKLLCTQHSRTTEAKVRSMKESLSSEEVENLIQAKDKLRAITIKTASHVFSDSFAECQGHIIQKSQMFTKSIQSCLNSNRVKTEANSKFILFLFEIIYQSNLETSMNEIILRYLLSIECLIHPFLPEFLFHLNVKLEPTRKYRYRPKTHTRAIIKTDDLKNETEMITIDTFPIKMPLCPGICLLENEHLFSCGGISRKYLDLCFYINLRTGEWEMLPNMLLQLSDILPILIDDHIYVFGGQNLSGIVSLASTYSIQDKKWESIPPMPVKSSLIYPVKGIDCIIFAGYQTEGIYVYNLGSSSYKKIFSSRKDHCILLKDDVGTLFFLTDHKIYYSSIFNYGSWKFVGTFVGLLGPPLGLPNYCEGKFYFSMLNGHFVFDIQEKTLLKQGISTL